jgi:tRNA uridine 5-carboxymethylaminomethyl modification enzyme
MVLHPRPSYPQARIQAEAARLSSVRVSESAPISMEVAQLSGQAGMKSSTLQELLRRPHIHYP